MGVEFTFPIEIKNEAGNETYCEESDGCWCKSEYDSSGNETYYENSRGDWFKREYDSEGNETYHENSDGHKTGTPRSANTCEGKVVEVDGVKYELKTIPIEIKNEAGKETYYENSNGYWFKREYDAAGKETYYENSYGLKTGTPRSAKTCEGKVVEVDGVKYELKTINN